MISQIRHTGLVVADLELALSFWRDLLGFKVDKMMDESGSHIDLMMGLKNVMVTTVKMSAPQGGVFANQEAEFVDRLSSLIPLARMANQDEYRSAVQFLCSEASAYLNGQNIVMDGGRSVW